MQKKEGRPTRILLWLLALMGALVLLAGPFAARALAKASYPRTYSDEVEYWAAQYDVDENLVYAIIRTESSFNPAAQSYAGAIGLMQMTEETFDWLKPQIAAEEDLIFADLYKPAISIRFGVYFLSLCLEKYGGDPSTAAAAYHSGMGTVNKLLQEEDHTTDGIRLAEFPYRSMNYYVSKVNRGWQRYSALYAEV